MNWYCIFDSVWRILCQVWNIFWTKFKQFYPCCIRAMCYDATSRGTQTHQTAALKKLVHTIGIYYLLLQEKKLSFFFLNTLYIKYACIHGMLWCSPSRFFSPNMGITVIYFIFFFILQYFDKEGPSWDWCLLFKYTLFMFFINFWLIFSLWSVTFS